MQVQPCADLREPVGLKILGKVKRFALKLPVVLLQFAQSLIGVWRFHPGTDKLAKQALGQKQRPQGVQITQKLLFEKLGDCVRALASNCKLFEREVFNRGCR